MNLLSLNVNRDNYSLRTYFNFETDISKELKTDPRFRVYNFFLEARDVFDVLSFRLGRQPMINNVVGGLFDGVSTGLAIK